MDWVNWSMNWMNVIYTMDLLWEIGFAKKMLWQIVSFEMSSTLMSLKRSRIFPPTASQPAASTWMCLWFHMWTQRSTGMLKLMKLNPCGRRMIHCRTTIKSSSKANYFILCDMILRAWMVNFSRLCNFLRRVQLSWQIMKSLWYCQCFLEHGE